MKLLCTGDLHLGAGAEYGRAPGDRLADQEQVWTRILELAVDEAVDGVLFAGDAFEGPTPTSEHYDAFLRPIRQVLQERIPVLAVSGNGKHDSAMRSTNALAVFDGYGIHVVTRPEVVSFAGCTVACLPWVSPARLVAAHGGGDRDEIHAEVAQLLLNVARDLYLQRVTGAPTILLAHWSVSGSSLPNGLPVDQLREPVIPLPDLEAIGFDAIALGHIHKPQMFSPPGALELGADAGHTFHGDRVAFYVGSPMPLNFGEAHTAHGVWIIETGGSSSSVRVPRTPVDGQSNGSPAVDPGSTPGFRSTFHPIESRPFVTIGVDFTDGDDFTQILEEYELDRWPLGDGAIVRVRYRATSDVARAIAEQPREVRRILSEHGAALVRIQPDIIREERARVEGLDEAVDELQALDLFLVANGVDEMLADRMRERTRDYLQAAA